MDSTRKIGRGVFLAIFPILSPLVVMKKDAASVTPEGKPLARRIVGVEIRSLRPQEDERGDITELYNPAWGYHPLPMVYAYRCLIRPGKVKGWQMHKLQDDRIAVLDGVMTWALFDDREGSETRGLLNVFTFSERNRALITVPSGVWHAVKNTGTTTDAVFVNFPTRAYNHADPDKYRLPSKNDLIPFDFTRDATGW
jgi:dTDP-4-dehydrorhamnose 3,5-epimerase